MNTLIDWRMFAIISSYTRAIHEQTNRINYHVKTIIESISDGKCLFSQNKNE